MSRRWGPVADKVHYRGQIDKILGSHTLHGSESLCKLLRYLADHALRHPGSLKEYQIATEVFGRPSDFDPHLDSLVRVQAGRLRTKLSEYYVSEGAEDPIIVELPKGTYTLAFHQPSISTKTILHTNHEAEQTKVDVAPRKIPWAVLVLSILLAIAVVAIAGLIYSGNAHLGVAGSTERV